MSEEPHDETSPLPQIAYDAETLRESFTDPASVAVHRERLESEIRDAPDDTGEMLARGDLVDLLRIEGSLDAAGREADAAVDRADIAGTAAQQHLARLRRARVHQWRGEFGDSNVLYTELLAAAKEFGPVVEAFTRQHAGENDYDQGHWDDARTHFERALTLREDLELDDAELSRTALAATGRHLGGGA